MMLIKIILKILAVPVMILCKLIRFLIDMAAKISCLVLGSITLFVLGCAIYTIVKHNWSQTIILGVVSTGIGSFGDWLGEYIRS